MTLASEVAQDTLTARPLTEVVVRAYESNRSLLATGAAIGVLSQRDLNQRFATPTLVPALNTLPGVRMDERSPGSYRLSIRGSLIRSPFGVRNVKVYYDEMPLTDAGGNTPLNSLDPRMLGRIEVIKGPSGSLYGANTGGTVLLGGPSATPGTQLAEVGYLAGAYGLRGFSALAQTAGDRSNATVSVNHLQSDGYRTQSLMTRDNVAFTGKIGLGEKQSLSALLLYTDLRYQTPGGLTEAQFRADPRAARPATRTLPGSVEQQAGIFQKTGYLGLVHRVMWSANWQTSNVVYGSITNLTNPFITNYEKRDDRGLGARSVTRFTHTFGPGVSGVLSAGGEWQTNRTLSRNYGNRGGQQDTLQTDDALWATQWNVFAQEEVQLARGLIVTAGLSRNQVAYDFTRYQLGRLPGPGPQSRTFSPVWLWRASVLKTLGSDASLYVNLSSGYSAPTSQEVLSSAGFFNANLNPERGQQAELGVRGRLLNRIQFDLVGYTLQLRETIVRRSLDNGAEFFVNAGRTDQYGLETYLSYDLLRPEPGQRGTSLKLWQSLTLSNYRYREYQQLTTDLSGNRVPGVAPVAGVWGLDAALPAGFYAYLTFQFLPPFALNDANTAMSDPTRQLQATIGYRRAIGKHLMANLYAGGDNLLDQTYSIGYDLNAVGNRYYNAAPRRNFTVGVRLTVKSGKSVL
ncbi:TonB-dependent receptor [Fibrella sp. WM1]|uniref:TonB-dependent receptor n=1 Tax=Fibrella musci TaxID=3242485 RepID=UPI0035229BB2